MASTVVKGAYWFATSGLPAAKINSTLFTHLLCGFANLNDANQLTIPDRNSAHFSNFTQTVQQNNPSVKTLLSIGGGGASSPSTFASMVSQSRNRKSFIDSSIKLARSNNFHGLDLDCKNLDTKKQMTNLGSLLKEWREAVALESDRTGYAPLLLAAATSFSPRHKGVRYPIEDINASLDWINVMAYDYYAPGSSHARAGPPAALRNPNDQVCGEDNIRSWITEGVPAKKLVVGLPFHGYAWRTLSDENREVFAAADGVGKGEGIAEDGSIDYSQIINFINKKGAVEAFDPNYVTDYCYSGTTWIGFDGPKSITKKIAYAKEKGLRGYFARHLGADRNWTLSQTASDAWERTDSKL